MSVDLATQPLNPPTPPEEERSEGPLAWRAVPSAKRERQKAARAARQEEMRVLAKRRARQRQIVVFVGIVAVTVGLLFLLGVVGGDDNGDTDLSATQKKAAECTVKKQTYKEPPPMTIDTNKIYKANVQTDAGTFTVALDAKRAPKTVNNFVFLARYHYYDGITFHRVIHDFVVQGGDPEGTGSGGPGYKFDDESLADTEVRDRLAWPWPTPAPTPTAASSSSSSATPGRVAAAQLPLFGTVKRAWTS